MNKDICYLRPKINKNSQLSNRSEQFKAMKKRNHSINYNKYSSLNKNNVSLQTLSLYDYNDNDKEKNNYSLSSLSNDYLLSSFNADNKPKFIISNNYNESNRNANNFNVKESNSNRKINELLSYINQLESTISYYTNLVESIKETLVRYIFKYI